MNMEKKMDKLMKTKFLMFENDKNVCWLDASIALVAHNRTFKKIVENSPESQINKIISAYDEATNTFNNSESEQKTLKTQEILLAIQSSTLKYLKQFLKFIPGEPDSAFCALLNLVHQDKSKIKEYMNVSWIWRKQCSSCGVNSKSSTILKPIITLSKVDTFQPECPSSIYVCTCKLEQEMKLIYKELPPCLIFHFEKGVSTGTNFPVNFSIKGREYQLTGIVILEKSSDPNLNHFVTWIRNPVFNIWLECNDLNTGFATFTPAKPEYDLKDVYIAVFEAFDNLDRMNNDDDDELSVDQEQDVENSNVELIDLSDEEGDGENADSCEKPCKISNKNVSVCDLKFTSEVPLDEHKIETKSDSQHKAIDEFMESKELKAEIADYKDNTVRKVSIENKNEIFSNTRVSSKTSAVENLEIHSKEKTKDNEEECISSSQNISVSSFNLPNKISLIKHESKAESDNFDCQNKSFDNFLTAEATDNQKHKVADALGENKNEKVSSLLNSASVDENITVDDTSYKETQNVSISDAILEEKTDASKDKVNRYDENKLQLKMKQVSLKITEKKCINPNEEKRGKVEDRHITSSKGKKERTDGKYVTSDKEKNVVIMNDQCAGTSLDSNGISENICQSSESTSISKDVDCHKKKSKVTDNKNVKELENTCQSSESTSISEDVDCHKKKSKVTDNKNVKELEKTCQSSASTSISKDFDCHKKKSKVTDNKNVKELEKTNTEVIKQNGKAKAKHPNRKPLSKENREKLRSIIDVTVSRTYAAFFDGINQARENKLSH